MFIVLRYSIDIIIKYTKMGNGEWGRIVSLGGGCGWRCPRRKGKGGRVSRSDSEWVGVGVVGGSGC